LQDKDKWNESQSLPLRLVQDKWRVFLPRYWQYLKDFQWEEYDKELRKNKFEWYKSSGISDPEYIEEGLYFNAWESDGNRQIILRYRSWIDSKGTEDNYVFVDLLFLPNNVFGGYPRFHPWFYEYRYEEGIKHK